MITNEIIDTGRRERKGMRMNETGARYGGFLLSVMPYRKLRWFLLISHFRLPPFFFTTHFLFFFFFFIFSLFPSGTVSGGKAWKMEENGGEAFFLFFSLLFLLLCFFCCPFIFLQQSLKKTKPHKLIMYPHPPCPASASAPASGSYSFYLLLLTLCTCAVMSFSPSSCVFDTRYFVFFSSIFS